jgi:hypothetical protein
MKLRIMQFSPVSAYFIRFRSKRSVSSVCRSNGTYIDDNQQIKFLELRTNGVTAQNFQKTRKPSRPINSTLSSQSYLRQLDVRCGGLQQTLSISSYP